MIYKNYMESRQPGVTSLGEKRWAEAPHTLNYCRPMGNCGIRRTLEEVAETVVNTTSLPPGMFHGSLVLSCGL